MGNPLRFLGTGIPQELERATLPGRYAVEATFRCHQQQHLLRPDRTATELVLGCFGRAYDRYPSLNLVVLSVLSNHGCFVALPDSAHTLSSFMRDFMSSVAVRMNDHRDRDGTFWECRYRAIPILDEASLEDRFRYVLTHGTKENLVWNATDWPGVTSIPALLGGRPLRGRWRDRGAEYELRRRRSRRMARAAARGARLTLPRVRAVWQEYPIPLVPLPHWTSMPIGKRRALVADIVKRDAETTSHRHQQAGTRPLGQRAVLAVSPFARPRAPKRGIAPRCHATTGATRRAFRRLYSSYVEHVRASRDRVRASIPKDLLVAEATLPPFPCRGATTPVGLPMDSRRAAPHPKNSRATGPPTGVG